MEAAIGVILGALATVLASRYYFLRSINKRLGVYRLLNSLAFAGIAPDVRKQLNFRFQDKEVNELQQLVFLVANDGERAISNVIEPLTLIIRPGVEILDASILHRHPEGLEAQIVTAPAAPEGLRISFTFPLLNKGEFFVVKLLLSGRMSVDDLSLSILADDLPRSLRLKELPPWAAEARGYKFEWGLAVAAGVVLLFPAWICHVAYLLHGARRELFPFPWSSFVVSPQSVLLLIPGALLLILFSLLGLAMLGAAIFGGEFPPSRGPRFPLPKELRGAVFPSRMFLVPAEFSEPEAGLITGVAVAEERSDQALQRTGARDARPDR